MTYTIREVESKAEWERFVLSREPNTFLQSWNWGVCSASLGEEVYRRGLYEADALVGAALLTRTPAKRGPFLACPGGPLLDWNRPDMLAELVVHVRDLARREGAWFVRMRPFLHETEESYERFRRLGFRNAPTHMHAETTLELDIRPDEQDLLAGMRKNTRYSVRRAERDGVVVRASTSPEAVDVLYRLQEQTVARHKFVPFPLDYLRAEFEAFAADEGAVVLLGEYEDQVVAAAMIILCGDTAVYHYGASSNEFPKVPASHLVQWAAIKEAKRRGYRTYNFWGIAKDERPDHPWAGLTLFKRGFGGDRVDYVHAQDLPTSPLYRITYAFETIRRRRRGL